MLLDTHAFLWFVLNDPRLSANAAAAIADPENDVDISPATYWEIAIKISLGKYSLEEPLDAFIEHELAANQFRILPIEPRHVAPLISMPYHRRDPFDRLLVAQCKVENVPIVSADQAFDAYGVQRLW